MAWLRADLHATTIITRIASWLYDFPLPLPVLTTTVRNRNWEIHLFAGSLARSRAANVPNSITFSSSAPAEPFSRPGRSILTPTRTAAVKAGRSFSGHRRLGLVRPRARRHPGANRGEVDRDCSGQPSNTAYARPENIVIVLTSSHPTANGRISIASVIADGWRASRSRRLSRVYVRYAQRQVRWACRAACGGKHPPKLPCVR
jgi:hypothetical protein